MIRAPRMMDGPDIGSGAVASVVGFSAAVRSLAAVLRKVADSAVSNTLRPDIAVTFVSGRSWHRLTAVPGVPNNSFERTAHE